MLQQSVVVSEIFMKTFAYISASLVPFALLACLQSGIAAENWVNAPPGWIAKFVELDSTIDFVREVAPSKRGPAIDLLKSVSFIEITRSKGIEYSADNSLPKLEEDKCVYLIRAIGQRNDKGLRVYRSDSSLLASGGALGRPDPEKTAMIVATTCDVKMSFVSFSPAE
jgi:hypothetical protein